MVGRFDSGKEETTRKHMCQAEMEVNDHKSFRDERGSTQWLSATLLQAGPRHVNK